MIKFAIIGILCSYSLVHSNATLVFKKVLKNNEIEDYQIEADNWLQEVNSDLQTFNSLSAQFTWVLSTNSNVNEASKAIQLVSAKNEWKEKICSLRLKERWLTARQTRMLYLLCRGPHLSMEYFRMMELMSNSYNSEICLSENKATQFLLLKSEEQNASVYPSPGSCLHGEPDLERLMKRNDLNADQLRWTWTLWHNFIGPQIKEVYPSFVQIQNAAAAHNGYKNMGVAWREELEMEDLEIKVLKLYEEIKPLYMHLHAVVRHRLFIKYGPKVINPRGPIPIHLLGNMWGQDWSPLTNLILPTVVDLEENLQKRNWTVHDMVLQAEDMYASWGLPRMTEKFWNSSIFEPQDSMSLCHGTAANLYRKDDFRMLLCAKVSMDDFYVIHHEMGHIQYYMAYQDQPAIFQEGANSAFHESIGDVAMHAVMTPQHLNRLGLLSDEDLNDEATDTFLLLQQALSKIPEIPFALIIDKYRWDIFKNKITPDLYNHAYWALNNEIRGVAAPGPRGEEFFDAGAKFHIPDNTPYIRYFLSSILQMDMFKALCQLTVYGKTKERASFGQNLPLHRCDIYGSKKAGKKLLKFMEKGSSQKWPKLFKTLTGNEDITVRSLLEFYAPIHEWLMKYIEEYNVYVGW